MFLLALIYFARCFGESHRVIGCYLFCSRIQLNSDQKEIVDFATAGHNLFITGQGGVGKSEAVKQIIRCFKASGKIVGVICSSGNWHFLCCHRQKDAFLGATFLLFNSEIEISCATTFVLNL